MMAAPHYQPLLSRLFRVVAGLGFVALVGLLDPFEVGTRQAAASTQVGMTGLLPLVYFFVRRNGRELGAASILWLPPIFLGLSYGFGGLVSPDWDSALHFNPDLLHVARRIGVYFIVAFGAAVVISWEFSRRGSVGATGASREIGPVGLTGFVVAAFVTDAISGLETYSSYLRVCAWYAAVLLFSRERSKWVYRALAGVVALFLLLSSIADGLLASGVSMLVGAYYARGVLMPRRRGSVFQILLLAFLLVIGPLLQGGKLSYRIQSSGVDATGVEQAEMALGAVSDYVSQNPRDAWLLGVEQSLGRLNYQPVIAHAVYVSSSPNYRNNAVNWTLVAPLSYGWIPRAIWPSKPRFTTSNELGRSLGVLEANDHQTALNIVPALEGWLFAGEFGVVVFGCVSGVFVALAAGLVRRRLARRQWGLVYVPILQPFIWMESSLVATINGSVISIIIAGALDFLLSVSFRRPRRR